MHIDIEKPERGYCPLWQKKIKSSLCAMHLCQRQLVPCSLPSTSSGILLHKAALLPREANLSDSQLLLSAAGPAGADTNTQEPRVQLQQTVIQELGWVLLCKPGSCTERRKIS